MARGPLKFIHASDFHLEQPLRGFTQVPEHLRRICLDAPFHAATRVFDAALKEDVDLVVLAGDLANFAVAGARAVAFLQEQFLRLAERKVAIYWAGGEIDSPEHWPHSIRWPENVTVFPAGRVQEVTHHRAGLPVANILGSSRYGLAPFRPRDFHPTRDELIDFALVSGHATADALAGSDVNYWALGGNHNQTAVGEPPLTAHYPGSPQGRSPDEAGPHGCLLGHVDHEFHIRVQFVPTDEVRYVHETLELADDTSRSELELLLRERARKLATEAGGRTLLVSWLLSGATQIGPEFRHGKLAAELLQSLREEFGLAQPALWSLSLNLLSPAQLPAAWHQEDTILGDYLRTLARFEHSEEPLELAAYLPEGDAHPWQRELAQLGTADDRQLAFREAAALGADMLRSSDDLLPLRQARGD